MRRSDVLGGGDAEQNASLTDPMPPAVSQAPAPEPALAPLPAAELPLEPGEQAPAPLAAEEPAPAPLIEAWKLLQGAIRERVKKEQYETWFRRAALVQADSTRVCLAVQNTFARDWLKANYSSELRAAVLAAFGENLPVDFIVDSELTVSERTTPPPESDPETRAAPARNASPVEAPAPAQIRPISRLMWDSDVALNPHYRFDNFVVGPCNRFAHAAALGVSEAPGTNYNPFFLHGSVGLGKTHLMQSMCYTLLERAPETRILFLSCETFVNHFIGALENGDLQKFRNKYRNVDVLVVDDIHMLANKERTQEEFFHTFNTLYNAGKQIVLSSDSPPKEIPTLENRLVSRFKWGLVTEVESPCYETRMAILKRKSRQRGHELPDDVARLLAEHIDTNIRELEGAVTRVLGYATLSGQEVTPALARKVLKDVFSVHRGEPSMEDVLRVVTGHFNVKVTDLQSRRRTNAIAYPRQVGMYLARKITRHSLEEIGGFFGGRDHSTVLYAVEKISRQIQADEAVRQLVAGFLGQLQHAPA